MSDFREVLHNEDGLEIVFVATDDAARVELKANGDWDLSAVEDVIVVVNGQGVEITSQTADSAIAELVDLDPDEPVQLMIRVGEFFEGWELG